MSGAPVGGEGGRENGEWRMEKAGVRSQKWDGRKGDRRLHGAGLARNPSEK